MTTLRTPLCDALGLEWPIFRATMAGAYTIDLVASVSEAGGLGGFGHAYAEPDVMRTDAQAVRARTQRPFAINLFAASTPDEPPIEQQRGPIAAVLALGAQAAQIGTAFLVCPESAASETHRKAIAGMDGDETAITRAFSGKPARGMRNQFIDATEGEGFPLLPFPAQQKLTAPLRVASAREGSPDRIAGWSGQAGSLARRLPAKDLIRTLAEEACDTIERLHRSLTSS